MTTPPKKKRPAKRRRKAPEPKPSKARARKQSTLRLPPEMLEMLDTQAAAVGLSRTAVIERLIGLWLEKLGVAKVPAGWRI